LSGDPTPITTKTPRHQKSKSKGSPVFYARHKSIGISRLLSGKPSFTDAVFFLLFFVSWCLGGDFFVFGIGGKRTSIVIQNGTTIRGYARK